MPALSRSFVFALSPIVLAASAPLAFAACSSASNANNASDASAGDGSSGDSATPAAPYDVTLLDGARIVSDSSKPNFQKVTANVTPLSGGPFANVKLVVDLSSTCFPFDGWASDKPPAGQNWPADCDAFDRNFEMLLGDPENASSPRIEMVRAITPFGGPLHIEQDVTDMFNAPDIRTHARTFEVDIPTYSDAAGKVSGSAGGWTVSAHLSVTPGDAPANVLAVIPILDGNATSTATPAPAGFTLPAGTTHARIEYRATGHGGATESSAACIGPADEFCKRVHTITLDGASLDTLKPWRTDCAKGCTVAHYDGGVLSPFDYCAQNPCGNMDSVRAPRANWCPGSTTPPFAWTPSSLNAPGAHTFGYAVDKIAGNWRVTATVYAFGD